MVATVVLLLVSCGAAGGNKELTKKKTELEKLKKEQDELAAKISTLEKEIAKLDPSKPIFLAEWGVGEFPPADKAGFITKALNLIPTQYPRVRLAVYWHERWENGDGSFSNLRV